MTSLTPRQREVLVAIEASIAARGVPPTVRELMAKFGFSSTHSAHCHLEVLKRKGYISRSGFQSRGIRVLRPTRPPASPTGGCPDGMVDVVVSASEKGRPVERRIRIDRKLVGAGEFRASVVKEAFLSAYRPGDVLFYSSLTMAPVGLWRSLGS